jgi:2-polyprenyl-3-methyl-5-hydroxy-6-metoxy-1,4-benzoquinol methylase
MSRVAQSVWSRVWSREFTAEENKRDIERERATVRFKKFRALIQENFGSLDGLKTVEVGAGRGIYSLLSAQEGARATLLDNDVFALKRAHEFFDYWKQDFHGVLADAFSPPPDLVGQFDVAMSFGFAEHFTYPRRFEVFRAHLKLLKPGGLLFVSVPNRAFLPYRVGKFCLEKMNRWMLGLEIPFSRKELERIGRELTLDHSKVIGSGVVEDTLNFWLTQRALHLFPFLWERVVTKIGGNSKKSVTPLSQRQYYFSHHSETWLDNYLGYALVLAGEKTIPSKVD